MMQPAFTLMEILTVIAIIAVLASLTFGGMSYYDQKMKFSRTEVLIASIERALEDYKSDNGSYPSGNIGDLFNALYGDGTNVYLATLNPELKGKQRNVSESEPYLIVDAWGKVLRYRHNKNDMANPKQDYDLISLGPNGVGDYGSTTEWAKADDIKNW
jgi:prepilin-type N-terminal cleavage/methylation domain-containing protein